MSAKPTSRFSYRPLLQVSAALGIAYAYLSNELALLEFRRRIEAYRHAVIVCQPCRRVPERLQGQA
jgi:hypothetical protein